MLHIGDAVLHRPNNAYFTLLLADELLPAAMILGWTLLKTGTKFDTVVMVTEAVCARSRRLLKNVFNRVVEVDVIRTGDPRGKLGVLDKQEREIYSQQMTKSNLFRFTEYKKVLYLDINVYLIRNIDELFELDAPAGISSLVESAAQEAWHGLRLPRENAIRALQLSRGIRGCLMLLKPSIDLYHYCQTSIKQYHEFHFRHPEEEFFTRTFLSQWTHIHAKFALIPWQVNRVSRDVYGIHLEALKAWMDKCKEMPEVIKWRTEAFRMTLEFPRTRRIFSKQTWLNDLDVCVPRRLHSATAAKYI